MFVHLNCHSNYSLLRGASSIESLLDRAKTLGMDSLALTDTDGLYGAIPFYKAARERGIKPIIGAQIFDKVSNAVLLASNSKGYSNLCRTVTQRHIALSFSLEEFLAGHREGLIIISSSMRLLKSLRRDGACEGLFVELTRFSSKDGGRISRLLDFSRAFDIPVVATNRVHFAQAEGHFIHRVLSAIRERKTVKTVSRADLVHSLCYLKSPQEMARLFKDLPGALYNSLAISERCVFSPELGRRKFPVFNVPGGGTPQNFLRNLCVQGANKRYGLLTDAVKGRLEHELSIICDLGLADYFLIVWDINNYARKEGIPSVGRGSAADSLVSYVLYITNVDPIKHDLFFERFLNRERSDAPDIDLDFCWRRRDRVIDYVYKKYGADSTAMISTHVTFGGRSALREITKALGIPIEEVDRHIKKLPYFGGVEKLGAAKETVPECRDIPIDREPLRTVFGIAKKIDGFPRHLSIHPGGIVISPTSISDFIPLETASKGIVVTQYDMYPVEDMGLLKIDLLGQRGLSVIDDTLRDLKDKRGIDVDFEKSDPTCDAKTKELVREGKTIGCFYIESPGMRLLLKKLKCDSFEGLVAASSIIRPGVASSGMMREYIERYNGKKPVTYLHPVMENELKLTYGVMVYQEDVIRIAHRMAGMTLGEADNLRRCMSKKRDWEAMEKYKEAFIGGARARGVAKGTAQEAWRQIESFAGYAFCKAHSASYAQISYRSAYLKAHYPAEFMANVIANGGGFYHTFEYVEEARRSGIKILLPDINRSERNFTAESGSIRIGLAAIKGIGCRSVDRILRGREKGFYESIPEFLDRTDAGRRDTENLVKCGAFDGLGFSRPELLWRLELCLKAKTQILSGDTQTMELPLRCGYESSKSTPPKIKDYSLRAKLKFERELLGFTAQAHPLDFYGGRRRKILSPISATEGGEYIQPQAFKRTARGYGNDTVVSAAAGRALIVNAVALAEHIGKEVAVIGWLVTSKRIKTKNGGQMRFLTMEDKTTPFEVTLFPKAYSEFGRELADRGPYIVRGRVEEEFGGITLNAHEILPMSARRRD